MLITALTKRLCEDLDATTSTNRPACACATCTREIDTLERIEILTDLRAGDVRRARRRPICLREGLDLPEVSPCLCARRRQGGLLAAVWHEPHPAPWAEPRETPTASKVILYADSMTPAMQQAIDETERRRAMQSAYNAGARHRPRERSIKPIRRGIETELKAQASIAREGMQARRGGGVRGAGSSSRRSRSEMLKAAADPCSSRRPPMLRDQANAPRRRSSKSSQDDEALTITADRTRRRSLGGKGRQASRPGWPASKPGEEETQEKR